MLAGDTPRGAGASCNAAARCTRREADQPIGPAQVVGRPFLAGEGCQVRWILGIAVAGASPSARTELGFGASGNLSVRHPA